MPRAIQPSWWAEAMSHSSYSYCWLLLPHIYIYFVSACNNWFPWKVDQLWSFAAPGRVQSFSKIKTDSDPGIDKGWVGWETLPKGFSYLVTQKNFKEIPMSHPNARQIMIPLVWGETWVLVLKGSKEIIMGSSVSKPPELSSWRINSTELIDSACK